MNKTIVASTLLLVAVAGCSDKSSQLEGKWKLKDLPAANRTQAQKNLLAQVTIEFKTGNTYSITAGKFNSEGTWSLSGSTATLTPTKVQGRDVIQTKEEREAKMTPEQKEQAEKAPDQKATVTLADDGKTLSVSSPGQAAGSTATMVKSSS